MSPPWDKDGYDHNVVSRGDLYACTKCDKMATEEGRLDKTVCNTDPDRCEGEKVRE